MLKKVKEAEDSRKEVAENFKNKLNDLNTLSNKFIQSANSAKSKHDRTVASLTAQNMQLKKRIEEDAAAAKKGQKDSASDSVKNVAIVNAVDISKKYAIMDITGKGEDLVAKLINKDGTFFTARRGTILQSGYIVEEITPTYVMFVNNDSKQYLYTTGTMEPEKMSSAKATPVDDSQKTSANNETSKIGNAKAPSLGTGMFIK